MSWRPSEDVERDKERAAEYEKLYSGYTITAPLTVELRTGIIIAARFADKLRRAAFAAFSRTVPEDVILRDIAELNKAIYDELTKRNIGKLDLVRISVVVTYNQKSGRLEYSNLKIERLYTEEEVKEMIDKSCGELRVKAEDYDKLRAEYEELKRRFDEVVKERDELVKRINEVKNLLTQVLA